jgi:hypothetical protein
VKSEGRRSPEGALPDAAFVVVAVLLAAVPYLNGLGFYSDDWAWLGNAAMAQDQSLMGVFDAILGDDVRMRPVQFLYFASLYKVFGLAPLGYHLVNTLVLAAGAILFYGVLKEVGEPRRLSLAVPIVYVLLPHFSTDRFWPSAYQAGLSMALYFLSTYADLRAWRSPRRYGMWKVLAVASLVVCALAYEVFLPLFLLLPLVVWYADRRRTPTVPSPISNVVAFAVPNLIGLGVALLYKVATTTRMDLGADDPLYHLRWFVGLLRSSVVVSFVSFGIGLPARVLQIATSHFALGTFLVGGVVALVVFLWLDRAGGRPVAGSEGGIPERGEAVRAAAYLLVGAVVFVAGYSIFLTNYNAGITETGSGNRIAIAGWCPISAGAAASSERPSRWWPERAS